ncbi:MAG: cyclic nucleotide-binding domain-containing protein [Candidatus Xenobia bacterium]
MLCLGSDSGFEVEHPTTGFAFSINGHWAIIDAPVCASYMLQQYGIDPGDVRVILETHGHEDHMGSAIHFLLDCITTGHAYIYVAAEPVYRTCIAKVSAILDITDEEAERLLGRSRRGSVIRIRPGIPQRLLGATWHFAPGHGVEHRGLEVHACGLGGEACRHPGAHLPPGRCTYWLRTFLCQGDIRALPPGATVVAEGESGDAWFIVLQGECEVYVGRNPVGRLGAGAFFGELSLLDGGKRKATVRSLSPIVLLRVPREVFREFVVANDLWSYFQNFWSDVRLLSSTRLFLGFPHEVVSDLARSCEHRTYAAGSVIIEQGAVGHELYVVVGGQISVVREEDGKTERVVTRGQGEVIGEYGVLVPGARRFASVVADTGVQVLVLTGETLDRLLAGQIPLQLRLVAMLKDRGLPVPALGGAAEGSSLDSKK